MRDSSCIRLLFAQPNTCRRPYAIPSRRVWPNLEFSASHTSFLLGYPKEAQAQNMFSKVGIVELHAATHERLDLLLRHIATVPEEVLHKPISGFGHPSIWKQLVHILTCEEGWVHDLQNKAFPGWHEEDCPTMAALLAAKAPNTRSDPNLFGRSQGRATEHDSRQRPVDWGGELRSPAFILLHVITHAFHHKGQVVAMLRILGYPAPDTDLQPV